jgi:hypothetical protein
VKRPSFAGGSGFRCILAKGSGTGPGKSGFYFIARFMKLRNTVFIVILSLVSFRAFAQDQKTVVAPHNKLEKFFSELETQFLKAEQDKDPAALNRLVSDDFHVITAEKTIPHSDWLLEAFARRLLSFHIRRLSVRELSPTSTVVTFVRSETYQLTATPQTEEHLIEDTWVNSGTGDNWRCTTRRVSDIKRSPKK